MALFKKVVTHNTLFGHITLVILACLLFATFTYGDEEIMNEPANVQNNKLFHRLKREPTGEEEESGDKNNGSSGSGKPEKPEKSEVSLSVILGIMFLVCLFFYCIGIGYKIFKIIKGTYVEEEPVFLKYK